MGHSHGPGAGHERAGDVGDSLPPEFKELTQGRVEVWTEFDEFVGMWEVNGADGGTFSTEWMQPGWYYVLLYNGDDDFFIDFFPEWYPNTPLYKDTPSNLVHVSDGEVSIDAELQLGLQVGLHGGRFGLVIGARGDANLATFHRTHVSQLDWTARASADVDLGHATGRGLS